MSQNMSMRAYARYRGISDGAVRKAIQTGRITATAGSRAQITSGAATVIKPMFGFTTSLASMTFIPR